MARTTSKTATPKVVRIDQRIVGWSVRKRGAAAEGEDIDPRRVRIDRREEGSWESVTTKIVLPTASGPKTVYFVIGFGVVCGRAGGREVCIERPLEFFVPAGQTSAEHQWVSATMRALSLAARGGFIAKALADLRQVSWDRGPIWFGKNRNGKGMVHDSEVAAIAWALQQALHRRGFLDEHGNEGAVEELAGRYARLKAYRESLPVDNPHALEASESAARARLRGGQPVVDVCPDRDCRGDMVMKDGCPTCLDCGYSKCA
ncbi:MAG: ribonucleoside-diphosphate reductase [Gammaproteobacteria bacterium]|nr:ribonucleoside-diphosphate reductase [Gammaproteobacteria bacterium]